MRGNNSVALPSGIRDSVRLEFFGKIAQTLSPFKKKAKAKETSAEEGKGEEGKGEEETEIQKEFLPELLSPPQEKASSEFQFKLELDGTGDQHAGATELPFNDIGTHGGELTKPKKKRKKKKKKAQANDVE